MDSTVKSVRSGEFVAEYIEPREGSDLPEEAIQPNGVDLSIGELYELEGKSHITNDEYEKATRNEQYPQDNHYQVEQGRSYVIVYGERISIPENHIGLVLPRSRLMRCGLDLATAVWDSGYEGIGEGHLGVYQPSTLTEDLRVGQMIFIPTDELAEHYDGSHQGEKLL